MSNLIGLCGKKRSGKDTIADYLVNNYEFQRYSFAQPLKDACKHMFLFDDEQVDGDKKAEIDERWGVTPRKVLQVMGTEVFQYDIHEHMEDDEFNIGRGMWVKRFEVWYEKFGTPNVVISDVRFHHEADKIREMGGEVWKIDRLGQDDTDTHPSEKEVETIEGDHYIQNHGTLEQLYEQVDSLFFYPSD